MLNINKDIENTGWISKWKSRVARY